MERKTLVEKYMPRVKMAEAYFSKKNGGASLDADKKFVLAQVLENTSSYLKYLNESFENSVQTQRSDMGAFKRFVLDIPTLALPNLIAHDLVLVKPLDAIHGYITYFDYVYGSSKGQTQVGNLITNPFKNGKVDPNFTSGSVEENAALADSKVALKWGPVIPGSINFVVGDDHYFDDGAGKIYKGAFASRVFKYEQTNEDGRIEGVAGRYEVDPGTAVQVGTVTYGFAKSKSVTGAIYDAATPLITFTTAPEVETLAISYIYNNIAIMQNDLPTVTAVQKGIYLQAEPRRIAISYSQIAAFQVKNENGADLAANLEKVAVGELKREIDAAVVKLLVDNAAYNAELEFNKTPRNAISLSDHYEAFMDTIEKGRTIVYLATQKFSPNYMICARDVLQVLKLSKAWKAAPGSDKFNGPYFAGTYDDLKVFVTPDMDPGFYVLGVKGDDLGTAAAVYAPYLSVLPTSVLQTPDGATSQGWACMDALKLLNADLLVKGKIYSAPQAIEVTAGN